MKLNAFQKQFIAKIQMTQVQSGWPQRYVKVSKDTTEEHITYYHCENRFTLVLADYQIDHDFTLDFNSEEVFLRFGLVTKGVSHFQLAQQERQVFFPSPYLCYEEAISGSQHWSQDQAYSAVEFFVTPEYLKTLTEKSPEELAPLAHLKRNHVFLSLPPDAHDALLALMQNEKEQRLTPLLLESYLLKCLAAISQVLLTGGYSYTQHQIKAKAFKRPTERVQMGIQRTLLLSPEDLQKIKRAKSLIDQSLPCPPTVHDLSAILRISEQKLTYGFKAVYQETIGTYIKSYRLYSAARLLSTSSLSLREIALQTGYSCTANLCTAFKQRFGQSPMAYRWANFNQTDITLPQVLMLNPDKHRDD